jgi:hypothetical protein
MSDIDLSNLLEDKDTLLKAVGLAYLGLGLYFGLKTKPIKKAEEPPPRPEPRTRAHTLSEMIRTMMEEAYGMEKESQYRTKK